MQQADIANQYLQYICERESLQVFAQETGFFLYREIDNKTLYIKDMFVLPEFRQSKQAFKLWHNFRAEIIPQGYEAVLGSTDINSNNPEVGIQAMLSVGFKVASLDGATIWYRKELKET